jgi:hypothetical protein
MPVDRNAALAALEEYAGLDEADARKLLDAVVAASEREALELLAGDAPVPSSLADARALRLRYVTESVGRALRPREVEVILRVSASTALSTLRRLNATYPRAVDDYLKTVIRQTSTVKETGDQSAGYRYEIYFDEPSALEYAHQLLQRKGLTHDVRARRPEQVLDLPRRIRDKDPLRVLGLRRPR